MAGRNQNESGLTDKQELFCFEYLKDFNAGDAYIRAGYRATKNSARVNACKLLKDPKIRKYLDTQRKDLTDSIKFGLIETVTELTRIAQADITDALSFSDEGVVFKDSEALDESVTRAIESITFQESIIVDSDGGEKVNRKKALKMHSKITALGHLANYYGFNTDFNQARAALKRYGLALVEDPEAETGWRLEKHDLDSPNSNN
jgi:phage terminase small subunit